MWGSKPGVTLAVLSFALVALATAATPEAEAHYCKSAQPSHGCGDCKDTGGDVYHKHLYNDGSLYCESGPCCDKIDAVIETNIMESLP
jgi:hypothetical protein